MAADGNKGGGSKKGGGAGSGTRARPLKQFVRTARRRKSGSTRWLQRQLNDPFVAEAKARGLRSRAAFKFLEIDDKYNLLKPGHTVVDLGAAPGGWSQIAAERVGLTGQVIAIDLLEIDSLSGVDFLQLDFTDDDAPDILAARLRDGAADLVMSDMAPNTTGHKQTDHLRIMALCEMAVDFAGTVLKPGGTFLAKTRRGGTEGTLLVTLKEQYKTVRHLKPAASRPESSELYVLATGFRG
ncbi:MAG: RlmE family RNA methyltransferase [Pseudomonadota bacterium]